jgi:hypothetical protein
LRLSLICVGALAFACKDSPPRAAPPRADAGPPAPDAGPPVRSVVTAAWRVDLPLAGQLAAVELDDGRIVAVGTLAESADPVTIGATSLTSRGDTDLVVLVLAADGAIQAVHAIGGPGTEAARGLVAAGGAARLLLETDGSLELAGKQLGAAGDDEDLLAPPTFLLVDLDPARGPIAASPLFDPGVVTQPSIAALPGGDLAVLARARGAAADPTIVQRRAPTGEVRWERRLRDDAVAVFAAATPDAALVVATDADDGFGAIAFDAGGAEVRRLGLGHVGGAADDDAAGAIHGVAPDGPDLLLVGAASGDLRVGSEQVTRARAEAQPFAVRWTPDGPAGFSDLFEGTGRVLALRGGEAILDVAHPPRGTQEPHRGTYLIRDVADPERRGLVPIVQYRYQGDDWETGAPIAVTGELIYVFDAVFLAGGGVLLLAHGDRFAERAVITRVVPPS